MPQPDIEIYVKGPTAEQIEVWLNTQFDGLTTRSNNPKRQVYEASWQQQTFEIMVLIKVQSGYTSIWFDHPHLPWQNDKACALAALQHLPPQDLSVRCIASGWQEGDAPDQWLQITANHQEHINWPS